MMARRYKITAATTRSVTLTPSLSPAAPAGITRLVLRGRLAGRGKFRVGKTLRVLLKPKQARGRGTRARRALPRKRGTRDGA